MSRGTTPLPDQKTRLPAYLTDPHHLQMSEHVAGLLNATVEETRRNPMDEVDLQALAIFVLDGIYATMQNGRGTHFALAIRAAIQVAYQLGRRSRHPRQAG